MLRQMPSARPGLIRTVSRRICSGIEPSTLRAYGRAFGRYCTYAARAGTVPLPAKPMVVAAFLTEQLEARANVGCVASGIASINFATKACGLTPLPQGQFSLLTSAARKAFAKRVRRSAELTPKMVRQIAEAMLQDGVPEDMARLGLAICWSYAGGARFSDLARTDFENISTSEAGLILIPSQRKNDGATTKATKLREIFIAAVGGSSCSATAFLRLKARFGWATGPLLPWNYWTHLRKLRLTLQAVCGLSIEEAAAFGTHAGRRGAALASRGAGAESRAIRAFAGVTGEGWDDVYADAVLPEERAAVSRLLMQEVAGVAVPEI